MLASKALVGGHDLEVLQSESDDDITPINNTNL